MKFNSQTGVDVLGAAGYPTATDLRPYMLTTYPTDDEQLSLMYNAYLKAYDNLTDSIHSTFHPVSTGAVVTSMQGARQAATDAWARGGSDRVVALQTLASLMGWFNANYVDSNGNVKWDALNQPVNAGIISGAKDAAKSTVDAAKAVGKLGKKILDKADDAASTLWWTAVIGGAVVLVGGGLLAWKAMDSGTARSLIPGAK